MSVKPIWVYVAGPYTKGDVVVNVREAILVGIELRKLGFVYIVPHHSHIAHLISPQTYDFWMELDFDLIERCDVLVRLWGDSSGAELEVEHAKKLGLRVIEFDRSWAADVVAMEVDRRLEADALKVGERRVLRPDEECAECQGRQGWKDCHGRSICVYTKRDDEMSR